MTKQTIVLVVSLFILIVIGMFSFTYLKKMETANNNNVVIEIPEEEAEDLPWFFADGVTAKHFFIDGKHTFAGEVLVPTPCDLLEVEAVVRESFPEQINLDFSVINSAEVCAQVITTQRFKTDAVASEEATVTATWSGKPVKLNLIPAEAGETPEEFEIFIKG